MITAGERKFTTSLFAERLYHFLDPMSKSWNNPPELDHKNSSVNFDFGSKRYQVGYSEQNNRLYVTLEVTFEKPKTLEDLGKDELTIKRELVENLETANSVKQGFSYTRQHYKFLKSPQIKVELKEQRKISITSRLDPIPLGSENHLSENLERCVKKVIIRTVYDYLEANKNL